MDTLSKSAYLIAICLSLLAGCVDAMGFLQLGGYFISFMSGNSTQMAVNLENGNFAGASFLAGIIVIFILGTMLGTMVRHFSKSAAPALTVLIFVTMLLAGAAFSHEAGWEPLSIAFMILAMGAENAIFQRNGDVVIGLTYMTGTLVKVGQKLAGSMLGGAKLSWVPHLALWLGLITGGAIGALLFNSFGLHGLWAASLWSGFITLIISTGKIRLP